jgi:hypothetical protein
VLLESLAFRNPAEEANNCVDNPNNNQAAKNNRVAGPNAGRDYPNDDRQNYAGNGQQQAVHHLLEAALPGAHRAGTLRGRGLRVHRHVIYLLMQLFQTLPVLRDIAEFKELYPKMGKYAIGMLKFARSRLDFVCA